MDKPVRKFNEYKHEARQLLHDGLYQFRPALAEALSPDFGERNSPSEKLAIMAVANMLFEADKP